MLSDRRQRILSALIEEYVARALPVGSRTLTERYHLGVSSATVRNDLSALEDAGFIVQPHTSAGRIPTDAGYRAFVDKLLASEPFQDDLPHEKIVASLRSSAKELDDLLDKTSAALANLTDCLSVILAPSLLSSHIRQLSFISLSNYEALIVAVAEDGQVANRNVVFNDAVTPDELAVVQNLFTRLFVGKSVSEMRADLDAEAAKALRAPLARLMLEEVIACFQENNLGRAHHLGLTSLMRKPEFSDSSSLVPLMDVLENGTTLFDVLDESADEADEGIMVRIGRENAASELASMSVVAASYGRGDSEGIVAVIGPTRMDYPHVIKAVRAAQRILHDD